MFGKAHACLSMCITVISTHTWIHVIENLPICVNCVCVCGNCLVSRRASDFAMLIYSLFIVLVYDFTQSRFLIKS